MKTSNFLKKLLLPAFSLMIFPSNVFAHPHHESDLIGALGIDHMLFGVAFLLISFFLLGKFSK